MLLIWAQSGSPVGVMLLQDLPSSRVTCTSPSSLPTQMTPFSRADSATAKMVP